MDSDVAHLSPNLIYSGENSAKLASIFDSTRPCRNGAIYLKSDRMASPLIDLRSA